MEIQRLIRELARPDAFPFSVESVEVRQTHVSAVFLAGDWVYKIKKPVNLGFLNYQGLERRRDLCRGEVAKNQELAPGVYIGEVPVARQGERLKFEGQGEVVEHAIKMRRLADSAHLRARLEAGEEIRPILDRLIERLMSFYETSVGVRLAKHHHERASKLETFERLPMRSDVRATLATEVDPDDEAGRLYQTLCRNAVANFDSATFHIGTTVSRQVFDRLLIRTQNALIELEPLIRLRASSFTRLTHGDLRLDHVYVLPDKPEAESLVVIDCIEFDDDFRVADVVSDLAFLAMDLMAVGRSDLARHLVETYQGRSNDITSGLIFPFFIAYRSAVRGKVRGLALQQDELHEVERTESLGRARMHWLLALDQLESPKNRPALLMVGGLPGTGKSTLARSLSKSAGFEVIRSDVVRKGLAGVAFDSSPNAPADRTPIRFGEGLYTKEWTDRTYAECFRRTEALLFEGKRVLIDATFGFQRHRDQAFALAQALGVRSAFLVCEADPEVVLARLAQRRDDPSDADGSVYRQAVDRWEPTDARALRVHTDQPGRDRVVLERLVEAGLI